MEHGSKLLPGPQGEGAVFCAYEAWLKAALARWQPRLVVYEAPFLDRKKTPLVTATRLIGLGVITVKCCHEAHIYRVESVSNSAVKRFMTGSGRGVDKLDMIAAVRRFGFPVTEHNCADAIGIFLWAESRHAPQVRRAAGPFFAAAE